MKNKLFLLLILLPFFGVSQNKTFYLKCFSYRTFTQNDCIGCGFKKGQFSGVIITSDNIKHALHNPVKVTYRGNVVTFTDPFGKTYTNNVANLGTLNIGTSINTFMEGCLTIDSDYAITADSVSTVIGLQDSLDIKANSASPTFTGTVNVTSNINLDSTTFANQKGIVQKNGVRFLHNFKYGQGAFIPEGRNLFLGEYSGNFTLGSTAGSTTDASDNTLIGYETGSVITTGFDNTALGSRTLKSTTTGFGNTANGARALNYNTSGNNNVATGLEAMYFNTTGYQNTAAGAYSLQLNTDGYSNTAIGYSALTVNTSGYQNTAVGTQVLQANTTGANHSAFGQQALYSNTTGYDNSAFGYRSMRSTSTGYQNSAFGFESLRLNTTGYWNTAAGYRSMYSNSTGYQNSAFGTRAIYSNTTGINNTALGYEAGYLLVNLTSNSTPTNGLYLGALTKSKQSGQTNEIVIGYGANGQGSNTVILGSDTSILKTYLNGNVTVGVSLSNPSARLHLPAGTAAASTAPLKLTSGTLNTTAEAGAVEFLTDNFYGTITTGAARKKFALTETNGALRVPTTGAAATAGTLTLVDGTATVNTTAVNANSRIFFSRKTTTVIAGVVSGYTVVNGTSFTVTTTGGMDDDGTLDWFIIEGY